MRKLLFIFAAFTFILFLSSCSSDKGLILFNSVPITQNNALHDQKVFKEGDKVYYLFIAPKKMNNDFIRVQVFKMTDKASFGGYEVVRTKDFRLMKDQRYYHTDYFTLYETGRYYLQVFSHDDFIRPLAFNDFYIK